MSALEIVTRHYDASARGDLAAMTADFAPDITWTEAAGYVISGTFTGTEAIIEGVFGATAGTWEDFRVVPDRIIADEAQGTVIMVGTYTATHRDTRQALDMRAVHVWTVKDERITAFEQVCDSHLAQLAAISAG